MADLKRRIVAVFSAQNKAKGEMAGFRRDMDITGQAMKRMATGALAMAGMGGGLYAVKRGFDYVTKAAMKQEDAVFLLQAALKATGDYTGAAMDRYRAFAASIQQATVYGDEEVLSLMQLMKSLGVTSSGLERATRMSIGLAAATGRDVRSMSMYIALAQQGEFTMLRRYIPALRSTTDTTEQLRIVTEFAANGFKIAEAQAETTSGALKQMANDWGDVAEIIGDAALPAMKGYARETSTVLTENQPLLKRYLSDFQEGVEMANKFQKMSRQMLKPWWLQGYDAYKGLKAPPSGPRITDPLAAARAKDLQDLLAAEAEALAERAKAAPALNTMTQAQEKATASMYEMMMKARGLSKELAREKEITQFAALAKVRYGADVAGAQLAQERFIKALRETEDAKIAEEIATKALAIAEKERLDALEAEHIQLELNMKRWDDMARTMEDSFAGALERLGQDWRDYGEIAKGVLREILLETMRIMMWRPAAQALAGTEGQAGLIQMGLSGLGKLITGGGGGMPAVGTVPAEAGATLARYQHGGIATSPHLAMVGEVPEAFVPLSGGRSIPVEMRGEAGPPSFTFIVENQTGTPMRMEKQRQGPNPREFILTVVADDAAHGGVLSDIFQTRRG